MSAVIHFMGKTVHTNGSAGRSARTQTVFLPQLIWMGHSNSMPWETRRNLAEHPPTLFGATVPVEYSGTRLACAQVLVASAMPIFCVQTDFYNSELLRKHGFTIVQTPEGVRKIMRSPNQS